MAHRLHWALLLVLAGGLTLTANEPEPPRKPESPEPARPPLPSYREDDPVRFHVSGLFSIYRPAEKGRRQPRVLLPDEARAVALLGQIQTYIFSPDYERILVLRGVGGNAPGRGPNIRPPAPRSQLPNLQAPSRQEAPEGRTTYKGEYVALADLNKSATPQKLATTPRPLRTALIVASFPFKAQLEEFRDKLGLPNAEAVLKELSQQKGKGGRAEPVPAFRFLGVRLQRRVVDALGKPLMNRNGGWEEVDLAKDYQPYLFVTGKRIEPDTPEVESVSMPGLVMPRLVQARKNQYPQIETRLTNIRKTLDALAQDKGALPTHCLIRVLDVTIKPGTIYEYRMRVRLANPNFGRKDVANPKDAEKEELASERWYVVPGKDEQEHAGARAPAGPGSQGVQGN